MSLRKFESCDAAAAAAVAILQRRHKVTHLRLHSTRHIYVLDFCDRATRQLAKRTEETYRDEQANKFMHTLK